MRTTTRPRRCLGALGLLWFLAVPGAASVSASAAPDQGPSPGTTTPPATPSPGERLEVLGESISRSGEAAADDGLTWIFAGAVAAVGAAVAVGAAKAQGHRHRAV